MLFLHRRTLRWGAAGVAALLVLAGLGVVGVSYVAADKLVHPPRERSPWTPDDVGVPFSRVTFTTTDGIALAGWWMPTDAPRGTVVFLHGYGASKAQSLAVAPFLHAAGYDVLAFDFRAHGDSGGTHTTLGLDETRDVKAALAWLAARGDVDMGRVALFGWSMGAATALLEAPGDPQVRAVVADSSFASLGDVLSRNLASMTGLPMMPFGVLTEDFASRMTRHSVDEDQPQRAAGDLHRPLLLISGGKDALAPPADSEAISQAAGSDAQVWLVPGATHVGAAASDRDAYEAHVLAFLAYALAAPETLK